jgi:endonuclease VIII
VAEGDVIHRTARRLNEALRGIPLTEVRSPNPRGRVNGHPGRLAGRALLGAEARGKHLLLRFGPDAIVHSHLGMRGAWHVYRRGGRWRRPRSAAWLVLSTAEVDAVQFGGSRLALVDAARLRRDPALTSLGPDVLAPEFTSRIGADALRAAARDWTLGETLLDQRVIAGIGNVYKSEACFAAGVDPWRPLGDLLDEELVEVCRQARSLMRDGLERGGRMTRVYRHAGERCPRCGSRVRSAKQGDAARTTYWCASCQT